MKPTTLYRIVERYQFAGRGLRRIEAGIWTPDLDRLRLTAKQVALTSMAIRMFIVMPGANGGGDRVVEEVELPPLNERTARLQHSIRAGAWSETLGRQIEEDRVKPAWRQRLVRYLPDGAPALGE